MNDRTDRIVFIALVLGAFVFSAVAAILLYALLGGDACSEAFAGRKVK